ncbi:hypothetical protein [Brevundimonas sp.]|uniref:DUF6891 domain-containing protein n=1 Tax=Brevundimonas sp. TaxID=1871086 RepID=UPI0035125D61
MVNFLNRLFGRAPKPAEAEILADMRGYIETDVANGFVPVEGIAERAADVFHGEADPALLLREARRMTAEAVAAHEAARAHWPDVTDCDRLDAAFAALEASGVIARQNFSCCGTCGASEIWDEMKQARSNGRPVRGYAFYHAQDTESAAGGRGLYLNYGSCDEGAEAAVAIGHEIVAALAAKGLSPDWNGALDKRIGLPLDWKRRGPGPAGRA